MTMRVRRTCWLSVVWIFSMGAAAVLPAHAQSSADQPPRRFNEEEFERYGNDLYGNDLVDDAAEEFVEGDDQSGLRRFMPRWRSGDVHERNHRSVRAAFREVVENARKSTVQVLCDNRRVAMGTVVDANGFILTKASEIKGDVSCRLVDGRRLPASVVHIDDDLDLAVLHVEATDLVPVAWRPEGIPEEGSWLATTGLQELPSAVGVVSVAPRPVPMPRAVLGVMLGDIDEGAVITSVVPESAAEEAGLEVDDVILELDGKAVANSGEFVQAVREKRPGQRITLKIRRGDNERRISATLQEIDALAQGKRVKFQNSLGGRLSNRRWGFPSVIQHDTVLRPSDCGGPVVDLDGYAVGINIARAGRVASYALPVEVVNPLLKDLQSGKFGALLAKTTESQSTRLDELREAVRMWTDRFAELERQLEEARQSSSDGYGEVIADEQPSELIEKLELAVADAKAELEKAVRALKQLETPSIVESGR